MIPAFSKKIGLFIFPCQPLKWNRETIQSKINWSMRAITSFWIPAWHLQRYEKSAPGFWLLDRSHENINVVRKKEGKKGKQIRSSTADIRFYLGEWMNYFNTHFGERIVHSIPNTRPKKVLPCTWYPHASSTGHPLRIFNKVFWLSTTCKEGCAEVNSFLKHIVND